MNLRPARVCLACWYISVSQHLGDLRQKVYHEFKTNLGYTTRPPTKQRKQVKSESHACFEQASNKWLLVLFLIKLIFAQKDINHFHLLFKLPSQKEKGKIVNILHSTFMVYAENMQLHIQP